MFDFFAVIYASIAGVFIFGTVLFWLALVLLSGVIFWCDDREHSITGTFTVLLTILLFDASGLINITSFGMFVVGFGVYLLVGAAWSIPKWHFYLRRKRDELLENKAQFITEHNEIVRREKQDEYVNSDRVQPYREPIRSYRFSGYPELISEDVSQPLPEQARASFRERLRNAGYFRPNEYGNNKSIKPAAAENKLRITGWITYWPWSALWTIIDEPVRKSVKYVWDRLASTYQRMSDKAFADVPDDEEV